VLDGLPVPFLLLLDLVVVVAAHVFDVVDLALLAAHVGFAEGALGAAEVGGLALGLAGGPVELARLLEVLGVVGGDADCVGLDDHPGVLGAGREGQRAAVELVVELDALADLHGVGDLVLVVEQLADVDARVALLEAVAGEHVEGEGLERRVLDADVVLEEHADDRVFAGAVGVRALEEHLRLERLAHAVHGVVRLAVEDDLLGGLLVADLAGHGAEALLLVDGLERDEVLLDHHLDVDFVEVDVRAEVDDLEEVDGGQVDGRLVLAVVAAALPVGAEAAVVPVLVAPGRGHRQDPLGLHDVLHALDLLDVVLGLVLLRAAARVAQRLLHGALPLLLLRLARRAEFPGRVRVLDLEAGLGPAAGHHLPHVLHRDLPEHRHVLLELREVQREATEAELETALAGHLLAAFREERVDQELVLLVLDFLLLLVHVERLLRGVDAVELECVLLEHWFFFFIGWYFEFEVLVGDAQPAFGQDGIVDCIRCIPDAV